MLKRRGPLGRGVLVSSVWLVSTSVLSGVALGCQASSALSRLHAERHAGAVVALTLVRLWSPQLAAISLWTGVAATRVVDGNGVRRLLLFIPSSAVLSLVVALASAAFSASAFGVAQMTFWASTIGELRLGDYVAGFARASAYAVALFFAAPAILPHIHARFRRPVPTIAVALVAAGMLLTTLDLAYRVVRAS